MQPIDQTIAELNALFAEGGADEYYGEPVTQEAHMLQCARLAELNGADAETVVAAFLHDIGHLLPAYSADDFMDNYGRIDHERLGADFLRKRGFSEKVAQLIENHVNAKRYLTHKNPDYYTNLSEASRQTLQFQGGQMSDEEARAFESSPNFLPILRVRQWDEAAKVPTLQTPDVAYYLTKCRAHLTSRKTPAMR
ncbi:MAG: HD domain-containing protein [Bacteroidetes bacterium]|nr:HD domain-containing protein [Fibrella sp.]